MERPPQWHLQDVNRHQQAMTCSYYNIHKVMTPPQGPGTQLITQGGAVTQRQGLSSELTSPNSLPLSLPLSSLPPLRSVVNSRQHGPRLPRRSKSPVTFTKRTRRKTNANCRLFRLCASATCSAPDARRALCEFISCHVALIDVKMPMVILPGRNRFAGCSACRFKERHG